MILYKPKTHSTFEPTQLSVDDLRLVYSFELNVYWDKILKRPLGIYPLTKVATFAKAGLASLT